MAAKLVGLVRQPSAVCCPIRQAWCVQKCCSAYLQLWGFFGAVRVVHSSWHNTEGVSGMYAPCYMQSFGVNGSFSEQQLAAHRRSSFGCDAQHGRYTQSTVSTVPLSEVIILERRLAGSIAKPALLACSSSGMVRGLEKCQGLVAGLHMLCMCQDFALACSAL
jgi:hypothetical protein